MSEAAISKSLKTVDQLRDLCLSLMKAKQESDIKNPLQTRKQKLHLKI